MEIIVRNSPYPLDYIRKKVRAGINDKFLQPIPMEVAKSRASTSREIEQFKNRPGRVPWPWEYQPTKEH